MKRILFTGGGTAGHVTPNIALISELEKKEYKVYYTGRYEGIERDLIEKADIKYYPISAGKLRRYFDLKNIADIARIGKGFFNALSLVKKIKPDLVFSKGGFVSTPVVWAGHLRRIPVVIHESDFTPGLANKLSIPFATGICYSFPETGRYLNEAKSYLTGIPIRQELFSGNITEGKKLCGFKGHKPVLMIMGGSQGSRFLNSVVRRSLDELLGVFHICHICGPGGLDEKLAGKIGYCQFEYVNKDISHLYALADVVVSRAGATTLFELLSLKKPNLLVPLSKKASRGDQILNARSFKRLGFSDVIEEKEIDKDKFFQAIINLYGKRNLVIDKMTKAPIINSTEKIINIIENIKC